MFYEVKNHPPLFSFTRKYPGQQSENFMTQLTVLKLDDMDRRENVFHSTMCLSGN